MRSAANLLGPMSPRILNKYRNLLNIFEDETEQPYGPKLTVTQIQIIDIIAKRRFPRTQIILPTQYGKSLAVAFGVILRVTSFKEKWAIVAPTEDKARIIMDYIIDHIFDDPLFAQQLEYHGTREKLKQERSKTRLSFREGGEVRVYTANARNSQEVKKALMGFGSPNVILDESSLIPDDLYATVKRMIGGSKDNFMFEIGNPFFRNHFHRTWYGERYVKLYKNVYDALEEGRYTHDYIAEMRDEAFFEVLYECVFPEAEEVLASGYRRLVSDTIIDNAMVDEMPPLEYKLDDDGNPLLNKWGYKIIDDRPVLGVDVAAGGNNRTKLVVRLPKRGLALVARTLDSEDLEEIADAVEDVVKEWNIGDYRIVLDAGGVGHGLPAILRARGYLVKGVLFGESALDKTFVNLRAYMYWQMRNWMRGGGQLLRDEGFQETKLIYYRRTSNDKTQIEPKADMIKREAKNGKAVQSPDTADGLVLTFVDTSTIVEADDIDMD